MKVIDEKEHSRLLLERTNLLHQAGIQEKFLMESMTEYCGPKEVEWVQNFHAHRKSGIPGLLIVGTPDPAIRCQAIAGALLRNYIDARVVSLSSLLDSAESGKAPHPTVLLVPNFFVDLPGGKTLAAWKVQVLYDILLNRAAKGLPSVVCADNMKAVDRDYGTPFMNFLLGFMKAEA